MVVVVSKLIGIAMQFSVALYALKPVGVIMLFVAPAVSMLLL